jgi:hypothetical protein
VGQERVCDLPADHQLPSLQFPRYGCLRRLKGEGEGRAKGR